MHKKELPSKAVERCAGGDYHGALKIFEQGDISGLSPELASYYALCISILHKKYAEGRELCVEALKRDIANSVIYRNLGRILQCEGQNGSAYNAFKKGLKYSYHTDARCLEALKEMGYRRRVVVPFLGRKNIINKALGRLRAHQLRRVSWVLSVKTSLACIWAKKFNTVSLRNNAGGARR